MSGDLVVYALLLSMLLWGLWRAFRIQILEKLTGGHSVVSTNPNNAAQARTDGQGGIVAPLDKGAWLRIVNDDPDKLPSMILVAPPGSGKTEIAREILKHRRGEKLIIDPKRKQGKWSNQPYVARDTDGTLTTIHNALTAVYNEMMRRLQNDTHEEFTELTVLIDEFNIIADEDKDLPPIIKKLYQLGREYRIRVIICAQSELVQDLGINSRNRDGFTFVYLGDRATEKSPSTKQMRYPACIELRGEYLPIDNTQLDLQDRLAIRNIWRSDLANMNVPDRQTDEQTDRILAPNTPPFSPSVCLESKEDLVRFLVQQGWGVGKIRDAVKGDNKVLGEMVKRFETEE